jgi:death on curing protein
LTCPSRPSPRVARLDLADSALHAPQAGWDQVEFFPTLPMKAAVLPDGNKRTALAVAIAFCDVNGFDWVPPEADDPDGEETYRLMLHIAASSGEELENLEAVVAGWIAERLHDH